VAIVAGTGQKRPRSTAQAASADRWLPSGLRLSQALSMAARDFNRGHQGRVARRPDADLSSQRCRSASEHLRAVSRIPPAARRARSTAERPLVPEPSSRATSSASESACGPRSSSFSRGRSDSGSYGCDGFRGDLCQGLQGHGAWVPRVRESAGGREETARSSLRGAGCGGRGTKAGRIDRNRVIPTGCLRVRGMVAR